MSDGDLAFVKPKSIWTVVLLCERIVENNSITLHVTAHCDINQESIFTCQSQLIAVGGVVEIPK